ncbi:unannotated protein [freshwater metagenome]|uniref:Unannotated protein n=1 Tax=freshwater metagenome TaxID=449393 RepID=A0A6J7IJA8_9ZZZZ
MASTRMIVSDVWKPTSARPGMSGIIGRAPAASTTVSAVWTTPLTSRDLWPTKRPSPSYTVTCSSRLRYARPPSAMGSIRPNTRSRMAAQSAPLKWVSSPRCALCAAWYATSAAYTNIFEGMHPRFRQVPPNTSRSTMATSMSSKSGVRIEFPEPVPMMSNSWCAIGHLPIGRVHRRGARPERRSGVRGQSAASCAPRVRSEAVPAPSVPSRCLLHSV